MTILKEIDRYFWIFLIGSVFLGFSFPGYFQPFEGYVIYIVMAIMGFLYLKVDIIDIVTHIKQPFFLLYIAIINLVVTPIIIYALFNHLDTNTLTALVLLAALPSGITSAAFTDFMQGRTSLTLTIIIVTNLLSIITIPIMFWLLMNTAVEIDAMNLAINLLKLFFFPFLVAKVFKRVLFVNFAAKIQGYTNLLIILLLSTMIMISISFQAEYIMNNFQLLLKPLGILFGMFILSQLIGYFSVFWHKKGEKVAVSNSNMIMNNILGIILAMAFFNEEVLTIVILSLIPWNTMIILKHWYKRYLP